MPQCTCEVGVSAAYCEIHGFNQQDKMGYMQVPKNTGDYPSKASNIYTSPPSPITHPPHYTSHPSGIEAWTIAEAFSYHIGTTIAYLWRAEHKNGSEDLRKAIQHIEREILRLEKTPSSGPS